MGFAGKWKVLDGEPPASMQCRDAASRWHSSTAFIEFQAGLRFAFFCYFVFYLGVFVLPVSGGFLCLPPGLPPCTHPASFQLLLEYFLPRIPREINRNKKGQQKRESKWSVSEGTG